MTIFQNSHNEGGMQLNIFLEKYFRNIKFLSFFLSLYNASTLKDIIYYILKPNSNIFSLPEEVFNSCNDY